MVTVSSPANSAIENSNQNSSVLSALARDLRAAIRREHRSWTVGAIAQVGGGRSALTAIAELSEASGHKRVAVRAEVPGAGGLSIGSLRDQYLILEQLRSHDVPAPEPILISEGRHEDTFDLLVTEFIEGDVPHPWRSTGREAIKALRSDRRFRDDFLEKLAAIHAIAPTKLPANLAHDGLESARTHPGRSRERSRSWIGSSRMFSDDPVLTFTMLWLEQHQVAQTYSPGLIHGDYRLGNLVVGNDSVRGVLDWELAEAGEILSDVAWLCGPQGHIDGRPAGLFASEEDIVSGYETWTGRRVPAELFAYLKVEGTLRTAAVWAQLSADEHARGSHAMARRCQDSVVNLIGQCAQVLGLPQGEDGRADRSGALARGLASMSTEILKDVSSEPTAKSQGPATRGSQLLLRRIVDMSRSGPYAEYEEACKRLVGESGFEDHVQRVSTAQQLCAALAWMSTEDPTALESHEVRRVVGWSAEPGIAFANQMIATANTPEPVDQTQ
ncbi:aminoglycoside phosphotransferase [Rhodococcus wratislaviensis]|uniref:Aminoglycoside phosphotransferase n=1 Tax=Rhodococcus wratislaviensis TaxID=44752 RepID=A0A402CDA9_RHOWR|nr:aminoglycoside phosphotransferase [Rhodococcus wratislaviensis]